MPQIRCPNCGTTINLEARKNLDNKLILHALQKSPKSFTDLLNITHLPRKTLSLRLIALCGSGMVVKDGGYRLNGSEFLKHGGEKMFAFEDGIIGKPSLFTRRNVLSILMLMIITASVAATVSAMLYRAPPAPTPTQTYVSTFKMNLKISSGVNIYAYQTSIYYNPSELDVLEVKAGDYLGKTTQQGGNALFFYSTDSGPGKLYVGGSLTGDATKVSGDGILAIITFGVKTEGTPQSPYISDNDYVYPTKLLESPNHLTEGTLTLEMEG